MRKFIIKIIIFLIPVLVMLFILDFILTYNLRKCNGYGGELEVWSDIYDGNIDADVAIYGSSRAWVHIDPEIINDSLNHNAYNFGMDGHNFWLQYLRHIEYLKHNKKPKLIILSIDFFSFQKRPDLYNMSQFLPYMFWNKDMYNYTSSYEGYDSFDYYIPCVRYRHKFLSVGLTLFKSAKESVCYRKKGFKGMKREWNNDFEKAKKEMESYIVDLDQESINLFDKFINQCKEQDIGLVLVNTPEYIEGQEFVSNRQDIIKIFTDFAEKYNLLFLDYSQDEICMMKNLFYNATHLNHNGADLFTKKLVCDLKNIITQKNIVNQEERLLSIN